MSTDRGLQVERTVLAWRRTSAAVLVGCAVGARIAAPTLGGWVYPATAVIALTALAFAIAAPRALSRDPAPEAPPSAAWVSGFRRSRAPSALPTVVPRPLWMAVAAGGTCVSGLTLAVAVLLG